MIVIIITLFLIIAIPALFFSVEISENKIIIFLNFAFLLIIFAGFRDGNSVRDYLNYIQLFKYPDEYIEPTFNIISYIVKLLFYGNVVYLFLIYSFLGVSLKFYAIKQLSPFFFLSVIIYLSHYYILHDLTQIRVGVASGFLLMCIKPLYERNFKLFFTFLFIAILFHYSAIVLLPLWFINKDNLNKFYYYLLIPMGIIIYILKINLILELPIPILQEKIAIYKELQEFDVDGFNEINVFNSLYILRCLIYYFLLYYSNNIIHSNKYFIILIKIYAFSLFSLPAFSVMPVIAFRIGELFGIVEVILMPMIFYTIKEKLFPKFVVVSISFAILLFNIFYNEYIL